MDAGLGWARVCGALFILQGVCAASDQMPGISLTDQFDRAHLHEAPFDRPLVVVVADRRGSGHIESWVSEIYRSQGNAVEIVGLADLRGVPGFMKGPLRKAFRVQCASYPVLLDWTGTTAAAFPRGDTGIDIFVMDTAGRIVAAVSGPFAAEKLETVERSL